MRKEERGDRELVTGGEGREEKEEVSFRGVREEETGCRV